MMYAFINSDNYVVSVTDSIVNPELLIAADDLSLKVISDTQIQRGWRYEPNSDQFYPPCPYPSWTLDEATLTWQPPVPKPANHEHYYWDEASQLWRDSLTQDLQAIYRNALREGYGFTHTGQVQIEGATQSVTDQIYHVQAREIPDMVNIGNVLTRMYRLTDQTTLFTWRVRQNVRPILPVQNWIPILEATQDYYERCISALHTVKDQIQAGQIPDNLLTAFQNEL